MEIIILGNGKVGTKIFDLCRQLQIPIKSIVSPNNPAATHKKLSDVALSAKSTILDFSTPENAYENILYTAQAHANYVMGTTGWNQHEEAIRTLVDHNIGFAYTPNYLPIVHAFWQSIEQFVIDCNDGTHVNIVERRLRTKKSASHTALQLCEIIKTNPAIAFDKGKDFAFTLSGEKAIDIDVHFSANAWNQSIHFETPDEEKNNHLYAMMGLKTANWLQNKKGFFRLNKNHIDEISKIKIP